MWRIERTSLFVRCYVKLPSRMRRRVDEAVLQLAESENPADAGVPKRGRFKGYLAYEIGRSYRLIYRVVDRQKIILLVVVGDHKLVYGKD